MKRWIEKWFERSLPDFGQLSVWALLGFAFVLAFLPPCHQAGLRAEQPATMIAFLPESLVRSLAFYHVARVCLLVGAMGWATFRGLPWTPWLTAVSFTVVWALRMENVANGAHIFHATNMLLYIHAMWFQLYRHDIAGAREQGVYWQTPLYPRWVFFLAVFYLGLFHTWAGLTKIFESGLDWGNGLSLQLWIYLWGWPGSPFGQLVLASRTFARVLQTGALIIETGSFLSWFGFWPRLVVGLALLGFYCGVLGTFVDYGFHFNAFLVALYFLPVERWMTQRANRRVTAAVQRTPTTVAPANHATA